MNPVLEALGKRRSVRSYADREIPQDVLDQVLEAGLRSNTGRNARPLDFVCVTGKETLGKLAKSRVGSAKMLEKAGAAIVVIADKSRSDTVIEDASIAMAFMHLTADSLGLGSCWIQIRMRTAEDGTPSEDFVRNALSVPEGFLVEAILSLGEIDSHPEGRPLPEDCSRKVHREKF